MKYLNFIFIFFLFFYVLCEEENNTNIETEDPSIKMANLEEKLGKTQSKLEDAPEEVEKRRAENERKLKEENKNLKTKNEELTNKLNNLKVNIKELKIQLDKTIYTQLENETKITRAQFKDLFFKLLEFDKREENKDQEISEEEEEKEKNEENMSLIKSFANKIFDILVNKDLEYIEIDKIESYFDTKNILKALKEILKSLGLESLIDAFSGPLMESFGNMFNSDNNTNINNITNSTNNIEEKNADL